ncbi:MAG: hypothetical protein KJO98_08060 [Rhodothermia bacterium]|nr:hypothetical protein [Rhodothermia bacterium]
MKRQHTIGLWLVAVALGLSAHACRVDAPATDYSVPDGQNEFLDTLAARTFGFFWDYTNADNGLVPDRAPRITFSSVAAIGFGLTAYGIGAERGIVARKEAADRVLTTLRFLWNAPQGTEPIGMTGYRGFFYHFLDMESGERYRNVELSTIDTALLMGGVLFNQQYFDADNAVEEEIRALADSLYLRVEWDWAVVRPQLISMGWDPNVGYHAHDYTGYNEAMILYLLALGSPTYPAPDNVWEGFTSSFQWGDFYGYEHVNFSPLFGHQYSHVWVDFRGIQDAYMRERGIDYFENSRRATLSQREYAIDNPGDWVGYGPDIWGLTACDGPSGITGVVNGTERQFHQYWARGASLRHINDDGTIAPTAAGGSIPFAPEVTIPALMAMRGMYGDHLFREYGFVDAFNPSFTFADARLGHGEVVPNVGWFDSDYLGIDQGPIIAMIENYETGLIWEKMKDSPYIVRGLQRAGFTGGWLDNKPKADPVSVREFVPPDALGDLGETRIVILGSSTAEGVGPKDSRNAWVNRLRAHVTELDPTISVINLARGGYTTYRILPTGTPTSERRFRVDTLRNITAALKRNPDAIIVNLPSNDAASGVGVEEQLRNFRMVTATARAAEVPIWVTTPMPRNLDESGIQVQVALRDSIFSIYKEFAIDHWTGIAKPDATLDPRHDSGDNLHLNDAAHAILLERVLGAGVVDSVLARRAQD